MAKHQVGIHEAKTQLSRLLKRVMVGEEIIIAKSGHPIARILPIDQPAVDRVPGLDAGQGYIANDFDAPLPDEILRSFES